MNVHMYQYINERMNIFDSFLNLAQDSMTGRLRHTSDVTTLYVYLNYFSFPATNFKILDTTIV